ncbi:hypothetical protein ABZ370_40470 [Streptomyces sp. NPDC005962]|uniref:hypothetical protein n=1 Tax=Streptomyces sp. NPDC005962 TaxID=3154466 RepID=UPI0033CF9C36
MSSEQPKPSRFDEDVHFNLVSPGPPRYQTYTGKPVRYFTVVDKQRGAVLGYVWANDEDDAAAWEPREAAGPRAFSEGGIWHARLEDAKQRGLLPSQALEELLASPEGNNGRAAPDCLTDAPNAATVENPRTTEPLTFEEVDSPQRYARTTDKPVQYVTVAGPQGTVLGYVWANDEDDAAGWQTNPGGGDEAFNMGALYVSKLRDAKARSAPPTTALSELIRESDPAGPSHIASGTPEQAPSLQDVSPKSRLEEPMFFREKPGGPARYQDWTEKPVQYLTIVDKESGSILGYLWAGDEDDASAYEPREAGGPRATNEGMVWINELRAAKARGLLPSQALAKLYGAPEHAGHGRPLPGSLADAPNAAAVEAIAFSC